MILFTRLLARSEPERCYVMNVQFEFSQLDLLTKVLACSLHALVELLASAFVALIYDERVTHKCSRVRGG